MHVEKGNLSIPQKMSTSPYEHEPPRRSLIVNLFMRLAKALNKGGFVTPHLFGGSDLSKVEWEYSNGCTFFESIEDYASIDILDNKDVLDVGCGWGGKMIFYAENSKLKTICGFDLPGVYLPEVSNEFASQKKITNCFFKAGYAEDMPYHDKSFDIVIMEDVLEHVQDPEKVISECYRVLKVGGFTIIKFPSFKMMYAHHLDRALSMPALHYILPIKTWVAGLNYLLLNPENNFLYEPFDRIVSTKYCKSITKNLNGLDFANFKEIIRKSNLKIRVLKLVPFRDEKNNGSFIKSLYSLVYNVGFFKEILANFILFLGEKN